MISSILALLDAAADGERRRTVRVVGITLLALIADFAVFYSITRGVTLTRAGQSADAEAPRFLLSLAAFYLATVIGGQEAARLFLKSSRDFSVRLVERLVRLPLVEIEAIGRGTLMSRLLHDSSRIGTSSRAVLGTLSSAVRLLFGGMFALTISFELSMRLLVGIIILSAITAVQLESVRDDYRELAGQETRIYDLLRHQIKGAVAVKLHRGRSNSIAAALASVSKASRALRERMFGVLDERQATVNVIVYGLLGANVFLAPRMGPVEDADVQQMNRIVLWLAVEAISMVVKAPRLSEAAAALERLRALEAQLANKRLEPLPAGPAADRFARFEAITMRGLKFDYPAAPGARSGFSIGPVDLTLRRGDLVYVTGKNGSGKSTWLKVLTGLYRPTEGTIHVDSVPVTGDLIWSYRALFDAIFTDHHLFEAVPGIGAADEARASALLAEMGLEGKTRIAGGRITELDLSTGQRKRLAMVLARLRDKPIVVLDEWAAEQDPEYREAFYRVLLPRLRDEGKLVIVVTHDDGFFHLADRMLTLHDGELVELRQGATS